jgi:hypothetical protein
VLEDENSENEQESSTPPNIRTIVLDDSMSAFSKWAEENNVQAENILTLKRLQEKFLKVAFRHKRQKTIEDLFYKSAVK